MITAKEFDGRVFENKLELFSALRENKAAIMAQKKMETKYADTVMFKPVMVKDGTGAGKASPEGSSDKLRLKLVINTTKIMDGHSDVHLDGIWNKSVKEKKDIYLLQEHKMRFDSIITDEVKASVQEMSWKELGADFEGYTQALVFDAEISKERNPFMFEQYEKGYVKNHSVGMRYVKMELAINSDSKWDVEEKEVWDKYIDFVANKEEAEEQGYFWAVHEAKIIEGSAVPVGSNHITPTLSVGSKEAAESTSTKIGAGESTPQFSLTEAIKEVQFKI